MAASQKDAWKEVRRAQDMMAAGIEDDVVSSTSMGDVKGSRYPHILNHISLYNLPSIDEVLDLYQESPPPSNPASDPEPIYPSHSRSDLLQQGQGNHEKSDDGSARRGAISQEVIGPGAHLYNVRYAYPPELSPKTSSESLVTNNDSESRSSVSDEDSLYLRPIPEEPEPPELEVDVDVVKPVLKTRRQKETANARKSMKRSGESGVDAHA